MKNNRIIPEKGEGEHHELILTRSVLLAHMFANEIPPDEIVSCVRNYSEVTFWEELVCAAIHPKEGKLIAIVSLHQSEGYSGILRRHGSVEYVRFFIDWGDQKGYQALGLSHFKVCDARQDAKKGQYPIYHLITLDFDADQYWDAVMQGFLPKVRAVLSWNQVPELDVDFMPAFGNRIESQIRIDSEKELMLHFNMPTGKNLQSVSPVVSAGC